MPSTLIRPSAQGYLLLEVVIAFGVVAVGIFAMLSVQRSQLLASQRMAEHDIALEIANAALERLKAQDTLADTDGKALPLAPAAAASLPNPECTASVADYRANTPGLKHVRVAVSWGDAGRQRSRVELQTLMAKGGGHAK